MLRSVETQPYAKRFVVDFIVFERANSCVRLGESATFFIFIFIFFSQTFTRMTVRGGYDIFLFFFFYKLYQTHDGPRISLLCENTTTYTQKTFM
jgi:hypothetical protein